MIVLAVPEAYRGTLESRTATWLACCRALALSGLDGIEVPAAELRNLAAGDRELMERARRDLLAQQAENVTDEVTTQMLSLWRRAFELGSWPFPEDLVDREGRL